MSPRVLNLDEAMGYCEFSEGTGSGEDDAAKTNQKANFDMNS